MNQPPMREERGGKRKEGPRESCQATTRGGESRSGTTESRCIVFLFCCYPSCIFDQTFELGLALKHCTLKYSSELVACTRKWQIQFPYGRWANSISTECSSQKCNKSQVQGHTWISVLDCSTLPRPVGRRFLTTVSETKIFTLSHQIECLDTCIQYYM
jgi:hypothetical protein